MPAEGDYNLDNDAAGDLLSQISEDLFNRVIELLQNPNGHEYDGGLIGELFVRIEMIFALHAREMITQAPEQKELGLLIGPFVEKWQQYHRKAGHEVPSTRLQSMGETFASLLQVVREVHEDSRGFEPVEVDWTSPDLSQEHRMAFELFEGLERQSDPPKDPN